MKFDGKSSKTMTNDEIKSFIKEHSISIESEFGDLVHDYIFGWVVFIDDKTKLPIEEFIKEYGKTKINHPDYWKNVLQRY